MRYIIFSLIGAENQVNGGYSIVDFTIDQLWKYIEQNTDVLDDKIYDLDLGDTYYFTDRMQGLVGLQPFIDPAPVFAEVETHKVLTGAEPWNTEPEAWKLDNTTEKPYGSHNH